MEDFLQGIKVENIATILDSSKCKQTKANLIFLNLVGRHLTRVMVYELLAIPWKLLQVAIIFVESLEIILLCKAVMEMQLMSLDIVQETMVKVV